jgi:hypothetical protein
MIVLAGVSLALAVLWLLTGLAVVWDSPQRSFTRRERWVWIAVVAVLPLFGFAFYLAGLVVRYYFGPPPAPRPIPPARSVTVDAAATHGPGASAVEMEDAENEPELTRAGRVLSSKRAKEARFVLEVEAGPEQGRKMVIRHFPALIGRGRAVVALNGDGRISRRHAELFTRQGVLTIRDLNSTHGTRVNGTPVRDRALRPGDRIQIGETVLVLNPVE